MHVLFFKRINIPVNECVPGFLCEVFSSDASLYGSVNARVVVVVVLLHSPSSSPPSAFSEGMTLLLLACARSMSLKSRSKISLYHPTAWPSTPSLMFW